MSEEGILDLGTVAMHKKVIADIAAVAAEDIVGVRIAQFGLITFFCECFWYKHYPGVTVSLDKEGNVFLNLRVVIQYGLNIPFVAARVQEAVRSAVERSVDIDLKEINVNIHSVERKAELCG